jgi:hypothetical protein
MSEPRITFSLHAIEVLEQREIEIEWVARVLAEPAVMRRDPADPGLVHAFGAVPEREGRVLRVVYNQEEDSIHIVTVFFDRSVKGKL